MQLPLENEPLPAAPADFTALGALITGLIADHRNTIGELSSDLYMVRAGVAAYIALPRKPSIDGGGLHRGVLVRQDARNRQHQSIGGNHEARQDQLGTGDIRPHLDTKGIDPPQSPSIRACKSV